MNNAGLVAKNTLWQIIGKIVALVCSLTTTYLLTRHLGTEAWGNYVFITNVILLIFNLADFGVGTTTVKNLARQENKTSQQQKTLGQALTLRLLFSFLACLILLIIALTLKAFAGIRLLTITASLVIFCLSLRAWAENFFMAKLKLGAKVIFETSASVLSLLAIIFFKFYSLPLNLETTIIIWLISAAISAIAAFICLSNDTPISSFGWQEKKSLKNFVHQSVPIGVRQIVFAVYDAGIDSFFLKVLLGSTAVGFYGLSYKIYTNLTLGAAFFMNSLFPILVKKPIKNLDKTLKSGGLMLLISGILIASLVAIFAPDIINILGGENFTASVKVLQILCLSLIFSYLNHLTGYALIAIDEQKWLLYFSLLALVVNLAGNWLFIPQFGIEAAAWVTVATEGVILITTGLFLTNRLKSNPKSQ